MTDIDQRIEELRNQVKDNLSERDAVYHSLGDFLLKNSPEQEDSHPEEHRSAAESCSEQIPRLEDQINEILQCEEDLGTLKGQEDDLKERKKTCQNNLTLQQETLGEELYHLMNTLDEPVWMPAYEPVEQHIRKIRNTDTEVFQTENQVSGKNLFNSVIRKSRISLLKNRKKSLETSQNRLYRKCFLEALELGAGQGGTETPDGALLSPYFRVCSEWDELLEEEAAAEIRRKENRDRIKELCGSKGPRKRKEILEKEIAQYREKLREALTKWGTAVIGNMPENLSGVKNVIDAVRAIDALTEEGIELNLQIEKWEARKDIGRMEHDREYMTRKIDTLEEEIQARRQEIKVLKKEISQVAREIEKKKAFAVDIPGESEEEEPSGPSAELSADEGKD